MGVERRSNAAEAEGPDLDGLLFSIAGRLAGLLHRSGNRSLVSRSCPPSSVLCVFLFDDSPAGASERSTHTKAVRKGEGRPQEAFFSVVRGCDAAAVVQLGGGGGTHVGRPKGNGRGSNQKQCERACVILR